MLDVDLILLLKIELHLLVWQPYKTLMRVPTIMRLVFCIFSTVAKVYGNIYRLRPIVWKLNANNDNNDNNGRTEG